MDKNELFDLCLYMAASAEGLRWEPKDYGPLRLLEVLSRLARLVAEEYKDDFLEGIAEEVDRGKNLVMIDRKEFYQLIKNLVIKLVQEAKNR